MTVKEAIALLQKMPDHSLAMMIDCPYCGKGNQLSTIGECVILGAENLPAAKQAKKVKP